MESEKSCGDVWEKRQKERTEAVMWVEREGIQPNRCGEQSWKALFVEGATPKFVDGQDGFCVDYKLAFVEW